jgi:hypothetical protein
MVVNYFNILWTIFSPNEAKPVLIVYSDAVLTFSISFKRFQSVPWWGAKEIQGFCCV